MLNDHSELAHPPSPKATADISSRGMNPGIYTQVWLPRKNRDLSSCPQEETACAPFRRASRGGCNRTSLCINQIRELLRAAIRSMSVPLPIRNHPAGQLWTSRPAAPPISDRRGVLKNVSIKHFCINARMNHPDYEPGSIVSSLKTYFCI